MALTGVIGESVQLTTRSQAASDPALKGGWRMELDAVIRVRPEWLGAVPLGLS
jgi:hypothetical protein